MEGRTDPPPPSGDGAAAANPRPLPAEGRSDPPLPSGDGAPVVGGETSLDAPVPLSSRAPLPGDSLARPQPSPDERPSFSAPIGEESIANTSEDSEDRTAQPSELSGVPPRDNSAAAVPTGGGQPRPGGAQPSSTPVYDAPDASPAMPGGGPATRPGSVPSETGTSESQGTPRASDDGDVADDGSTGPEDTEVTAPLADMILRNMSTQPGPIERTEAPAPAARAESSLSEMVREVADRILVGEAGPSGQQEVRIILKDEVLGGTEIRIHEEGGATHITFVAADKDVENFLSSRQEEVATALGERLDREIRVAVTDRDGTPNQSADERGRDGQQGQDQPNDGRSRNRRSVRDERER